MVRDKYTAAPRGFAFVHFYTVSDAAKALQALQVTNPWLTPDIRACIRAMRVRGLAQHVGPWPHGCTALRCAVRCGRWMGTKQP